MSLSLWLGRGSTSRHDTGDHADQGHERNHLGERNRDADAKPLVECAVTDPEGRLVARASSTCMTLRGAQAQGR